MSTNGNHKGHGPHLTEELADAIVGQLEHRIVEANLDRVYQDAVMIFMARNAEAYNQFVKEELRPLFEKITRSESDRMVADTKAQKDIVVESPEHEAEILAAIARQTEAMLEHMFEHCAVSAEDVEHYATVWDKYVDGTIAHGKVSQPMMDIRSDRVRG